MAGGGVGSTDRVEATTLEEWSKVLSDETTRHVPLLAMAMSKGKVKTGLSGGQMRWTVKVKKHALSTLRDMEPIDFQRVNRKANATLPWRGWKVVDAISKKEKLENRGPNAILKVLVNREDGMKEDAMDAVSDKLYIDGNATGNDDEFHGIESFMSTGTQTAGDHLASVHNDTYAGLSTAVGAKLGNVQQASTGRAWTPVIVDTNYTPSGGTQKAWSSYADEHLRHAIIKSNYGRKKKADLFCLNEDSYEEFLNLIDDKERLVVNRGTGQALASMGFTVVQFDGAAIMWDEAVPTTDGAGNAVKGYGWNTDAFEVCMLTSGLFEVDKSYNPNLLADQIALVGYGNFKFSGPRNFVKLVDLT